MTFDPKSHIMDMRGKQYLEVKWRLVWFRDEHPTGSIQTEIVSTNPPVVKALILDGDKLLATGHASATLPKSGNAVWNGREIEKAETAAIGRALAHAGYGTQFTDEDEGEHLADSPVEKHMTIEEARAMTTPKGTPLGTLDVEKLRTVIQQSPSLAPAARLVLLTDFNMEA